MIKINLLPQEMAGGRASGTPSAASGSALVSLVIIAILLLDVVLGGYLYFAYNNAKSSLADKQAEAKKVDAALKAVQDQFDEMQFNTDRMERIIQVARTLDPPDRLLWSRKLNMLPLLVPDGVYLTQISVTRKVEEVETEKSIADRNAWEKSRKGTPPSKVVIPVFSQSLFLDGLAYVEQGTENQRLSQIILFNSNLRNKKAKLPFDDSETEFMTGFTPFIVPSAIQETAVDGRTVTQFRFSLSTNKLRIEEKQPTPAAKPRTASAGK